MPFQSQLAALPRMAVSLALAVLAVCALIFINEAGYHESRDALDDIAQASLTRGIHHRLLQLVLDAETGSRGYLLTGDPRYLEPYDKAIADIGDALAELRRAHTNGAERQAMVAELARHVQRKLDEMDLSVRMRKQGKEDAWKFVLLSDVGKLHMDAIREQSTRLIDASTAAMQVGQQQVRRTLLLARVGVAALALAALLAFYMYLRQSRALREAGEQQQRVLQAERDLLERQVRERTATLAELATHLQQVREDERAHLARELHDELGALLTAAKLDVARLRSRLGTPSPELGERLRHLTETLNSGIALKRRIIEDLRPSSLTNLGLTASLEILAREFSERSGMQVRTALDAVELDEPRQLTVYRIVQEALTNVGKYAQAKQVDIAVRDNAGQVEVAVRDDGVGFDVNAVKPSTHGLAGMRHRVEAAGGRLTVSASPGQGTRIVAVLPARA